MVILWATFSRSTGFERINMNIVSIILLVIAIAIVSIGFFMWLWNITMPDVFGLKKITFWQSMRLLLLSAMLFGSGVSGKETAEEVRTSAKEVGSSSSYFYKSNDENNK
jgi:hypothetical protein